MASIAFKGDDFIVAGTRPLIVHLVARESDYPLLTSADIDVRLTAGSLITHSTHYEGVRRLQPLKALAIGTGGCTEIEYPIRDEKEFNSKMPHEFYAEHLVNALSSAVSPFKGSSVNVLMSGGKDSRTITATCYGNNIRTKGIVYDAEGGEESTVAQLMANAVGSTLEVRRQRIYADPIEGSLRSHMRTEGLLTAVPHQITFAEQEKFDGPVLHGHGHLLRGGFASTMSPDVDYIKKVAVAPYSSGWIRAEASRKVQNYLSDWMVMRGKGDFRNLQYWSHHDLRCGVHQAPGILDYDGTNRMIYPLLDDKLVRLSNRIPLFYKVRELSVFSAIKAFAPKVAELPLYGEMWRFEAKEELDGYPGRDKRATAVDKNHTVSRGGGTVSLGRPQVRDTDHISADYIMSSRIFSEIKPMLTDRMVNIIESYASGLGLPQRERETHLPSQRSARRKMLEVFGLCTLFEGQWLRPYRAERDLSEFTVL